MKKKTKIAVVLITVMAIALLMGTGPGIYLVNPDPNDPEARRFLFGMPIIWVWVVFWLMVEGACIVVASRTLWKGRAR
jgi:hypothetical protein